jgi:hypothetical protein
MSRSSVDGVAGGFVAGCVGWFGGVRVLRLAVGVFLLCLCTGWMDTGSAWGAVECSGGSCSAWWRVLGVSRPTHLQAGGARKEVQEIVTSTSVAFQVKVEDKPITGGITNGLFVTEPYFAEEHGLLPEATAGNIQKALETVSGYGPGTVVEGAPGRFVVTTPEFAEVPPLEVAALESGGGKLGEASSKVVSAGAPDGEVVLTVENVGDVTVDGAVSPVSVVDSLPAGLRAVSVSGGVPEGRFDGDFVPLPCRLEGAGGASCSIEGSYERGGRMVGRSVPPFDVMKMVVGVIVEGPVSGENRVSVSGGGAPAVSASNRVVAGGGAAPFGVEQYGLFNEEAGGGVDLQAGSHPFQQTTVVAFNTVTANAVSAQESALTKDVNLRWPAGLIGDPVPFVRCSLAQFFTKSCPAGSVMGVATTVVDEPGAAGILYIDQPLYNVEPAPGQAARFGFLPAGVPAFVDGTVRTGQDYGVTVHVENVTQVITFLSAAVTVWGVPGAGVHDEARGEGCLLEAREVSSKEVEEDGYAACERLDEPSPPAFLTLPTACTGELETVAEVDSWQQPLAEGSQVPFKSVLPALDGCNRLPFTPSLRVTPDGSAGSTPTGLTVDEHVPQESTLSADGLSEAAVKGLSVTLPAGVQLNPSSGDGLMACSEEQIGLHTPAQATCPEAAKIATVTVHTPVLAGPLEGAAYVAAQNANPFGSLLAMYVYAEEPVSGVRVKSAGEVLQSQATGQLTGRFEEDPAFKGEGETSEFLPQAPFEDIELHFFGGERAPLATPAHCGSYETTGTFTPWSANQAEKAEEEAVTVHASSTFDITSGPHASPCPAATLPFAPSMTGGTLNINAGQFSPLTTTIIREDGEQSLAGAQVTTPDGLEGLLTNVKLCPEAQANDGSCPPESKIGETTVSAGVGSDPVAVKGGSVYLTEKYDGAPFGLSIVDPVKAGPFDLEHDSSRPSEYEPECDCLVVRARIQINPETGALTVTTNTGPEGHAIPSIIDGIPVQIKRVNVTVNRPDFTFNPTSCAPLQITSVLTGTENTQSPFAIPFQAANCALLKFNPAIQVTVKGHASKANGANVHFKITFPKTGLGSQSWLEEAKFDIPKQLPARLETLQKSCLAQVFETDRAACPAASIIGHAIVHTQVVPVPLEGPLYFVSYGNEKFPDAVLVLKGYGITIEQHGETFIDKKTGITSATFRDIPDVPFETLEVNLPEGPYSEFGANLPHFQYNFCGHKLTMPTLFKAANGQETHTTTPIQTTNCPKHKTKTHHKKTK